MNLVKLGLVSILAAGALFAGTYKVDSSHSNVGFKVKHMMVSNVIGKFDKFTGTFEYDEKTNSLKSLNGIVEVSSINTENEKRDNHLKASDFFAAEKYPQITFKLEKVEDDKAYGKLTMRGVTKDVVLDVETSGTTIKDPWGNTRTGLSLSGKVNRYDYGIKYNSILEAGGVAVGEIVKLDIEIEGILAK
jgi:polyisoprenoid-binding protein YceI